MALKLGKTVLAAIVAAVQKGMLEGTDISQELRDLEVEVVFGNAADGLIELKTSNEPADF